MFGKKLVQCFIIVTGLMWVYLLMREYLKCDNRKGFICKMISKLASSLHSMIFCSVSLRYLFVNTLIVAATCVFEITDFKSK